MSVPSLLLDAPACCEDEKWKLVPDWPHEASTCGRVRSTDRLGDDGIWRLGAFLPPQPDKRKGKGYLYVDLTDGKRRRRVAVAVVVLEAHRGLRPPGCEACHNHGVRTDNHLSKLRWDTREANLADMAEHARLRTVTEDAAMTVPLSRPAGHSGVRVIRALSRAIVTGDAFQGTGSSRPFSSLSSLFTSVQPFPGTARTLSRSPRNRQAA